MRGDNCQSGESLGCGPSSSVSGRRFGNAESVRHANQPSLQRGCDPRELYRYWRQGQTGGIADAAPHLWHVAGVIAGSVIRVELLPGEKSFDVVIACVLIPLGAWILVFQSGRSLDRMHEPVGRTPRPSGQTNWKTSPTPLIGRPLRRRRVDALLPLRIFGLGCTHSMLRPLPLLDHTCELAPGPRDFLPA
jgi:hypothetical protein